MVTRLIHVAGARPNFMKIAPLMAACSRIEQFESRLVHTGQHYDSNMSTDFFDELGLDRPDVDLKVGSGSQVGQTWLIMQRLEPVLADWKPDLVIVVGDVNSTLAGALTAAKMGIPVAHVEAGLRSHDRSMPEETNRCLTDHMAELLFVSEPSGMENLAREGIDGAAVHFVGNVMIDSLLQQRKRAASSPILDQLGLEPGSYAALTLHRPSNVDRGDNLRQILLPVVDLANELPVIFPVHPRAEEAVRAELSSLGSPVGLRMLKPLGYRDFVRLISEARLVLTDSGGIQEETTILRVPCVTLRDNTERPITLTEGTNRLGGTTADGIRAAIEDALAEQTAAHKPAPRYWDGRASERIARVLRNWAEGR